MITNLVVSISLIVRIWRAKKLAGVLAENTESNLQVPYSYLILILVESAALPAFFGILNLSLFPVAALIGPVTLTWLSTTVSPPSWVL